MRTRRLLTGTAAVFLAVGLSLVSSSSHALSSFNTALRTIYPAAVTIGCNNCHTSGGGTPLNAYGDAFLAGGAAGATTINAIAGQDSDGDGFANGVELAAGFNAGDAGSQPPAPTTTTTTTTTTTAPTTTTTSSTTTTAAPTTTTAAPTTTTTTTTTAPTTTTTTAAPTTTTTTAAPTTTTTTAAPTTTTTTAAPTTTTTTAAPTTTTTTAAPTTTTTTAATTSTTTAAATTTTTVVSTTTTTIQGTINLTQGWNLIGNSSDAPLDVAAAFGDAGQVTTVWKWVANQAKWAFFAPSLVGQSLTDYAASKGYDVLVTVNGGEGIWVNAVQPFSFNPPAANALGLQATPSAGWNLIAIGQNLTPSQFNTALGLNLTTLWAWDSALAKWYFYAPSLEANGTLSGYIASKDYLDFATSNKTLGPGVGFWLNIP